MVSLPTIYGTFAQKKINVLGEDEHYILLEYQGPSMKWHKILSPKEDKLEDTLATAYKTIQDTRLILGE